MITASPVLIFIICYMVDRIAVLAVREPPLWLVRLITWIVGLVLVIIVSFGPIRFG